jgi:hypothetical protein
MIEASSTVQTCKIAKFAFSIKWHIVFCILMLILLFVSRNELNRPDISVIIDPIVVALFTSGIFYLFIAKWPEFIKRIEAEGAVKEALIQMLKVHEVELKFFTQGNALNEMLEMMRGPCDDLMNNLKVRSFLDIVDTIYGKKKNIEICYLQRLEIMERAKLILEVWSPHLSMRLLSILWDITTDKNQYLKQSKLFIGLAEGYPEQEFKDTCDVLWERFSKSHLLFLDILKVCKEIYPNESYFNSWN